MPNFLKICLVSLLGFCCLNCSVFNNSEVLSSIFTNMPLASMIFVGLLTLFLGFAIGRFGDKYGGSLNAPHHWIYGLLLVAAGFVFISSRLSAPLFFFGIGHFISDLDDFLHLRVWGVDKPHKWKFWSVK